MMKLTRAAMAAALFSTTISGVAVAGPPISELRQKCPKGVEQILGTTGRDTLEGTTGVRSCLVGGDGYDRYVVETGDGRTPMDIIVRPSAGETVSVPGAPLKSQRALTHDSEGRCLLEWIAKPRTGGEVRGRVRILLCPAKMTINDLILN